MIAAAEQCIYGVTMRNIHSLFLLIFTLILLSCVEVSAQCTLTLLPPAPPVPALGVTTYNYQLGPACSAAVVPALKSVVVTLNVNSVFLPVTSSPAFTQTIIPGQGGTLKFDNPTANAAYTFSIAAQSNLSSSSVSSTFTIVNTFADGSTSSNTGPILVPKFENPDKITGLSGVAEDESTVDVLLGLGSHITFSNYPDYTVATNSVLVSTGVGNAIPSLLIGAGFTTGIYNFKTNCVCWKKKLARHSIPDSIFVNAQVPLGSSSSGDGSISGFTFGAGYKVQKFLEILIGFSLAQYNEPSTGFRNAAAAVVAANAALAPVQQVPLYLQYSASDIRANKPNALDGFPLLQQQLSGAPGGQIYQGSALLSHYRGGLFLGVAYPFSLSKLFSSH